MNPRRFDYSQDAETVAAWLKPRGLPMVPEDFLPALGFIDPQVACAFAYVADGGLAVIDRLVTNPMSTPEERSLVVPELFRRLARESGAKQIIAFSDRPSTARWLQDGADMRKHSDGAMYFRVEG